MFDMFGIEIVGRLPSTRSSLAACGGAYAVHPPLSLTTGPQEGLLLNPWDMPLPSRLVLEDTGVPWRSHPGGYLWDRWWGLTTAVSAFTAAHPYHC